jgi:hypothetical protein
MAAQGQISWQHILIHGNWRLDLDRLGRRRVAALSFLFGWNLLNEAFHICLQFSTPHTIVTDAVRFMGLKFQRFA